MTSRARGLATRLGLRYQNQTGRLKFNKGGPTHSVWFEVLSQTLVRGGGEKAPFSEIVDIIDKYGAQVWNDDNDELIEPGSIDLYPVKLQWPEDRKKIISIFRELYEGRQYVGNAGDDSINDRDGSPDSVLDERHAPDIHQRWQSTVNFRPEPGVTREIEDLFLTNLWMSTPDSKYFAKLELGTHQTISELFSAIEVAFAQAYPTTDTQSVLGGLQKVVMMYRHLGPNLQKTQVLITADRDRKLQALRAEIFQSYNRHREDIDGDIIVAYSTAFFEHNSIDYRSMPIREQSEELGE